LPQYAYYYRGASRKTTDASGNPELAYVSSERGLCPAWMLAV
jgi:hypothetical protein